MINTHDLTEKLPSRTKCEYCNRFVKRGLINMVRHVNNDCPVNKPVFITSMSNEEIRHLLNEMFAYV